MHRRFDPRPRDPGEAPENVVARALAILEEETRAWAELRRRRHAEAPDRAPSDGAREP